MKKILYATDGSKSAEKAGEMVKDYLKAFSESQLVVLYVTSRENYAYDYVPDVVNHYEDQISNTIESHIKDMFQEWENRVEFQHKTGHTSTVISKIAEDENADLIVVGSHGRGFVDRALLGSVAHGVLNRSKLPVLVVR